MSLLDNESIILKNTDYISIGFPKETDIKKANNVFISGKYYKWENNALFDKYDFQSMQWDDQSYKVRSLIIMIEKSPGEESFLLRPGMIIDYVLDNCAIRSLYDQEIYSQFCIKSKSEEHLFKEAYKILTFFKEHIDHIQTYINIINYQYLQPDKRQYDVLVNDKGKLIFIPDDFKNATQFIEYIKLCNNENIKIYNQFDYITKFNIPWIC